MSAWLVTLRTMVDFGDGAPAPYLHNEFVEAATEEDARQIVLDKADDTELEFEVDMIIELPEDDPIVQMLLAKE